MSQKTYKGYHYEIHPTGVKMWSQDKEKDDELIKNWYFKPDSQLRKKPGHPSIHEWSPATDKQVQIWIDRIILADKIHKAHTEKVSGHKTFKYQVGDYLLHSIERGEPIDDSVVLYQIKSTSKSQYGNSYDLKGIRAIKCRDKTDHRVRGIYSPFAHVVENMGEFKKVEGKELEKLMTEGFAVK